MFPESFFHNLSPMTPDVVILEYAFLIKSTDKYLVIQYIQVGSLFLNLDLTN